MSKPAEVTPQTFTIGGHEMDLLVSDEAFLPNATTDKIARQIDVPPGSDVLDLGCGVGPLSIYLAKEGAGHVDAVDIVPQAVELAKLNVQAAGVADRVTVMQGDLFEPVQGKKYDIVVNDVSGIAEGVARISPWYPNTVPSGGDDGAEVVLRMFDEVLAYLKPTGTLYFATSSLSDTNRIMDGAHKLLGDRVEKVTSQRFPFCKELTDRIAQMQEFCKQGKISFEARRSRYLWTLDVYRAHLAGT